MRDPSRTTTLRRRSIVVAAMRWATGAGAFCGDASSSAFKPSCKRLLIAKIIKVTSTIVSPDPVTVLPPTGFGPCVPGLAGLHGARLRLREVGAQQQFRDLEAATCS